nr:hypothetical protein [Tanacetum cinerariifolium]
MAKTINGEAQIHTWVDGKKIIITESSVRRDLRLADENGVDCLPNFTIFKNLELMGPKTTVWNEFNSTMASAIIYLATNQKFNFSKLTFDSLIRNLDNASGKFLMYPRKPKRKITQVPQPSLGEDASKQERKIKDIDADEDITLVIDQDDAKIIDVNYLHGEEVFVEKEVADKEVNDEVQKVVEEVVEDNNTAKLIVDATQVSVAGKVNAASIVVLRLPIGQEMARQEIFGKVKAFKIDWRNYSISINIFGKHLRPWLSYLT